MIQTPRLLLREFTIEDAPFIVQLVNDPAWLQFIGDKGVRTLEDAEKYILNGPMKSYADNGFGLWLVELNKDNAPIGMCGLINRPTLEGIDIGFAYLPQYVGQGYAFEAATATLEYAKQVLLLKRVLAITNPENIRSITLLKKLGLQVERQYIHPGETKPILLMGRTL